MNIKSNKLSTTLTALSLITACVFTVSAAHAATQNEVQVTAVDFEGLDDNLYGARYVRYLDEVSGNSGAYLINPYLQRVSSLSGGYANLDGIDVFNLGTTFYFDDTWMLAIEGAHSKLDDDFGDGDYTNIDLKVGFNLSRQWQIGAGVIYQRATYDFNAGGESYSESENETSPLVFTRYTTVGNGGTGWDFTAQYTADDVDVLSGSARYFFSPGLSVQGSYSYTNAPDGFDNLKTAGVALDYWVNEQFSLSASYETDIDSDTESDVASLTASYRF
ncbi:hypothetical protein FJN14_13325 [Alteromonas mediterranea]|uniref:putative porin n=1 Tax=Alteromonas mediterranea TaxID=314275 RepID=UPI001131B060|nr:putative porin [Alteromonas mediterranea]QDG39381.1 hypothetical protein FJN14_13325 [Alteromonas mediterranea]